MSAAKPMTADARDAAYTRQNDGGYLTSKQRRRAGKKARHFAVVTDVDRQHWLSLYAGKRKHIREERRLARAFGAKRLGGVIGERIARGLFR